MRRRVPAATRDGMRRATWLIKKGPLHGKVIMQFRAEALGRETQMCCLLQNADFRLMSKKKLCTSDPFTIFVKDPLDIKVT